MLIKTFTGHCHYVDALTCVRDIVDVVKTREELPEGLSLRCEKDGKFLPETSCLDDTACVFVTLSGGLQGGKGGFGSLLRSIGAQIEKTTNHEAMRDLSGRRQRDVNNEERLKKYVAGAAEREREAREKREEKLEKLRRLAEGENKDKRGFSDPVYDKVRSETEERVHEAMEAALGTKEVEEVKQTKEVGLKLKRKSDSGENQEAVVKKRPKGLWLGEGLDDLDDSDLSDSDDEKLDKN